MTPEELRKTLRTLAKNRVSSALHARFDSSDVAQESFIQIWKQISESEMAKLDAAWLRCVVRGHAAKQVRFHGAAKRNVGQEKVDVKIPPTKTKGPVEEVIRQEEQLLLIHAFAKLEEKQKELLVMHFFKGKTYAAIAKHRGISFHLAKQSVNDAIRALQKEVASVNGR